jgi:hypothetical protein
VTTQVPTQEARLGPEPLNFDPDTIRYDPDVGWLYAETFPDRDIRIIGEVRPNTDEERRLEWEAVAFLAQGRFKVNGEDQAAAVKFLMHMLQVFRDQGLTVARPRELLDVPEEHLHPPVPAQRGRRRCTVKEPSGCVVRAEPVEAARPPRSAALDVPASLEEWAQVCAQWGVPARPDELVRVVFAAAWEKANAQHQANMRVVTGG